MYYLLEKCRYIDYCSLHEKFSTGLTNIFPRANMFLLLQYAPKHVFPLHIDENVTCNPSPSPKADLGHLLPMLDKASESQSRREKNCACNITKTGIFIKCSLQKWAKFQSDFLAEQNDENPKLGDISRIADISSQINGHSLSLSLFLSLKRSQIIAISVSPAFIVLSVENLFLAKYNQLCLLFTVALDQPRRREQSVSIPIELHDN